ncbi:hypothetical protein HY214_02245 [Candidatus Roizmanbacteria bacterium]|nr:hypothetical protein [Candidatus Roizmanbacteria bacterium]
MSNQAKEYLGNHLFEFTGEELKGAVLWRSPNKRLLLPKLVAQPGEATGFAIRQVSFFYHKSNRNRQPGY